MFNRESYVWGTLTYSQEQRKLKERESDGKKREMTRELLRENQQVFVIEQGERWDETDSKLLSLGDHVDCSYKKNSEMGAEPDPSNGGENGWSYEK